MVDIFASSDLNFRASEAGVEAPDDVILTPHYVDIINGYPNWSYPYDHPILYPNNLTFDDFFSNGQAVFDYGSVIDLELSPGYMDMGLSGTLSGLSTDWPNTFSDYVIYLNPSGSGKTTVELDPLTAPIIQGKQNASGNTPTGYYTPSGHWNDWSKFGLTLIPPRGARYASPKIGLTVGAGSKQWLTEFDLSVASIQEFQGADSVEWKFKDYEYPRSLSVKPVPDRFNMSVCPFGQGHVITGADDPAAGQIFEGGAPSTTFTITDSVVQIVEPQSIAVTPGETYTYSLYYTTGGTLSNLGMRVDFLDGQFSTIIASQRSANFVVTDVETRLVLTFTVPLHAAKIQLYPIISTASAVIGDEITISKVMLEESDHVNDWFSGNSGEDYYWQADGIPLNTRSYYYKDKNTRSQILYRELLDNAPLWLNAINVYYASLPIFPVYIDYGSLGQGPFGFGAYGGGFYGG